jgi:hypothetical protein
MVVPVMPVIVVVMIVVTMIVGLALIVVAIGTPWVEGDDNLRFGFRRDQGEKPEDSQDQEKILFYSIDIAIIAFNSKSCRVITKNRPYHKACIARAKWYTRRVNRTA